MFLLTIVKKGSLKHTHTHTHIHTHTHTQTQFHMRSGWVSLKSGEEGVPQKRSKLPMWFDVFNKLLWTLLFHRAPPAAHWHALLAGSKVAWFPGGNKINHRPLQTKRFLALISQGPLHKRHCCKGTPMEGWRGAPTIRGSVVGKEANTYIYI